MLYLFQGHHETISMSDVLLGKLFQKLGLLGCTLVVSKFEETVYNKEVKQWIKDNKNLRATMQALYNIVWGQCSRLMKNKLKTIKNFDEMEEKGDVTRLLKEI